MKNETLLLRQVHPRFVQAGEITSQVFKLSNGESGLSAYNGDSISPEDAHTHYTTTLNNMSCGVVGISKKECESCRLIVIEDKIPFEEHVSILYGDIQGKELNRTAVKLKRLAIDRGWLFGPNYR